MTVVDSKRQQNVSIGIARFRRSHEDVAEAIVRLDQSFLTPDTVHNLLDLIPTPEEMEMMESFLTDRPSRMGMPFDYS